LVMDTHGIVLKAGETQFWNLAEADMSYLVFKQACLVKGTDAVVEAQVFDEEGEPLEQSVAVCRLNQFCPNASLELPYSGSVKFSVVDKTEEAVVALHFCPGIESDDDMCPDCGSDCECCEESGEECASDCECGQECPELEKGEEQGSTSASEQEGDEQSEQDGEEQSESEDVSSEEEELVQVVSESESEPEPQPEPKKGSEKASKKEDKKAVEVKKDQKKAETKAKEPKEAKEAPKSAVGTKKTLGGGLTYEVLKAGKAGNMATKGKKVSIQYTGTLTSGKKFDSGRINFRLGAREVVQGMELGCQDMLVGESRRIYIPSKLGYGSKKVGPIPPNSDLIFEVTLLSIQ